MERENRERERDSQRVSSGKKKEREMGCAYRWEGAGITEETIETLFTWNM